MQKLVFTNGGGQTIDLTSGNFGITNWEGLSGTGLNIQTQQVPFQDGAVFLDALMEQREISVTVAIQDNNDLSLRYELKRQLISALNPKLGEGVLVYTNDYLSRQIKAVPQLPIFENKNSNDAGTLKASVTFSCPSPYWEDLEETVVVCNNQETVEIDNDGDIKVQLNAKINVENGKVNLQNITSDKAIETTENMTGNVVINTEIGNKNVILSKDIFNIITGATLEGGVRYNSDIILCGTTLMKFSYITKELSNIENDLPIYSLDITYSPELELFAVVGENKIYTSKDLNRWEQQTTGVPALQGLISWEDNVFKVKIDNNSYLKSANGVDWSTQTGSIAKNKTSVMFKNNYYRINATTRIQKSSDNTNWNEVFRAGVTLKFLVVIYDSIICFGVGSTVIDSSNGTDWGVVWGNDQTLTNIRSCEWLNKMWFISQEGTYIFSYDGEKIERKLLANESIQFIDIIIFENELYVYTTYGLFHSSDGNEFIKVIDFYVQNLGNLFIDKTNNKLYCNTDYKLYVKNENNYSIISSFEEWYLNNFLSVKCVLEYEGWFYISTLKSERIEIYKTQDFQTYTQVYVDSSTSYLIGLTAGISENDFICFIGEKGVVVKSEDGGSWVKTQCGTNATILNYIKKIDNTYYLFNPDSSANYYTTEDFEDYILQNTPASYLILYDINTYQNIMLYFGGDLSNGIMGAFLSKYEKNIIDKITSISDLGLGIEVGKNIFWVTGTSETKAIISYRQKYIGV